MHCGVRVHLILVFEAEQGYMSSYFSCRITVFVDVAVNAV